MTIGIRMINIFHFWQTRVWVLLLASLCFPSVQAADGNPMPPAPADSAGFIGAAVCGECHADQLKAWQGSHHDQAMQHATPQTVLGNFNNAAFRYFGVTSKFFRKGDAYYVNTDGADGKLTDYPIKYTFGVYPLQQYLIEFPDGRLQALGVAWDSHSKTAGGQRWIHVYPKDNVRAGETIHWTGIDQNWNHMCSECHSTNVHKNFDAVNNRFNTTWSEINVACESCHGPGSAHVRSAKEFVKKTADARGQNDGLPIRLTTASRTHWVLPDGARIAHPENPGQAQQVTDLCSRCHSRRSELTENYHHGKPLLDTHEPELLTAGKYYPDGRMQDEVYNYGSFQQSKMQQAGVTCNDCHEPHSLKLRAPGNAVCTQCHQATQYDTDKHHFHKTGTQGSQCADCHMPASTYMGVDRRHDHGFRIPRPDLTQRLGIPNACNDCHDRNQPKWALDAITRHFGHTPAGYQDYADTLHDARTGSGRAWNELSQLAVSNTAPAIARGTALWEMRNYLNSESARILQDALGDAEPLVRLGAVKTLAEGPNSLRPLLLKVVADPMGTIRRIAASGLAGIPESAIPETQREATRKATADYIATQQLNGDRPESQMNLGVFYAQSGKDAEAEAAYRMALKLRPDFSQAYVNLADLYRSQNREADAETLLRRALKSLPNQPDLHHALGLLLVRTQHAPQALTELERAYRLASKDPQYAYTYAVALKSAGNTRKAIQVLGTLQKTWPNNTEILIALVSWSREQGDIREAALYAERLSALRPQDTSVARVLDTLKSKKNH